MAINTPNADGSYTLAAPGQSLPVDSASATGGSSPVNSSATYTAPASTSITSATIAPQSQVNIPPPPAPTDGTSINASVPTPQAIIDQSTKPTQTDTQQSTLLQQIAQITGGQKSLATQQNEAETAAGLPALTSTVRSLSAQLQGYNDQASKLQLDASAGGTIQNQVINAGAGQASLSALNGQTQAALRTNQIQQAAIAGQALTAKAALYAAQNDYTNAKDAADKAAQVTFDAQTQKINGLKAQLDAIAPTLNKEEKARAALLQTQLDDRKTQIANQREDYKTGQAMAIAAIKVNPNDAQAQFAAQSALKLDPTDPQYLQKVTNLVGKYQQDPLEVQNTLLDQQYKRAQIAKLNADAKAAGVPAITNPQASVYSTALSTILGSSKFSVDQKKSVVSAINGGDDPFTVVKNQAKNIMGQTEATKLTSYEAADSAMQALQSNLQKYYAAGGDTNLLSGTMEKTMNNLFGATGDPAKVELATQVAISLQAYRNAISGTAYSEQEGKDITAVFPGINKSNGLNTAIIKGRLAADEAIIDGIYGTALGDKTYKDLKAAQSQGSGASTIPAEVDSAIQANAKVDDTKKTLTIPRSIWSQYPAQMDAIKQAVETKGYQLLIQ